MELALLCGNIEASVQLDNYFMVMIAGDRQGMGPTLEVGIKSLEEEKGGSKSLELI